MRSSAGTGNTSTMLSHWCLHSSSLYLRFTILGNFHCQNISLEYIQVSHALSLSKYASTTLCSDQQNTQQYYNTAMHWKHDKTQTQSLAIYILIKVPFKYIVMLFQFVSYSPPAPPFITRYEQLYGENGDIVQLARTRIKWCHYVTKM